MEPITLPNHRLALVASDELFDSQVRQLFDAADFAEVERWLHELNPRLDRPTLPATRMVAFPGAPWQVE